MKQLSKYIIIFFCITISACTNQNNKTQSEIIRPVKTAKVKPQNDYYTIRNSGTVRSTRDSYPSFKTPGTIKTIYVSEGDYVTEGDLIAELQNSNFLESFNAAEAKYNQVSSEVSRVTELYNLGSVAKNEYEKAISGLKSVTSIYEISKNNLEGTRLIAPISGTVQEVMLNNGQLATPASPVLNIVGTEGLILESHIASSLYLNKKNILNCYAKSSLITDSIPLTINFISSKANNNQLHKITYHIPAQYNNILSAGMILSISMNIKTNNNDSFLIPYSACFSQEDNTYIWTLNSDSTQITKTKIITANITKNGSIKVISGLTGNETIVTAGVNQLKETDKIRIIN